MNDSIYTIHSTRWLVAADDYHEEDPVLSNLS